MIRQLQLIQNAAARVLTKTRKLDHISPAIKSIYWLPMSQRIDLKIVLLVYKVLNGLGLKYMLDLLVPFETPRPHRSGTRTKQAGAAFSHDASYLWNNVPEDLRSAQIVGAFKSGWKTLLFTAVNS